MSQAARTKGRDNEGQEVVLEALYLLSREVTRLTEALNNDNNKSVLKRIDDLERLIMASSKELAADLAVVNASQAKTLVEIAEVQRQQTVATQRIKELEDLLAAGVGTPITQELIDAVAAVKAQAQVVDDAIPDVASSGPI